MAFEEEEEEEEAIALETRSGFEETDDAVVDEYEFNSEICLPSAFPFLVAGGLGPACPARPSESPLLGISRQLDASLLAREQIADAFCCEPARVCSLVEISCAALRGRLLETRAREHALLAAAHRERCQELAEWCETRFAAVHGFLVSNAAGARQGESSTRHDLEQVIASEALLQRLPKLIAFQTGVAADCDALATVLARHGHPVGTLRRRRSTPSLNVEDEDEDEEDAPRISIVAVQIKRALYEYPRTLLEQSRSCEQALRAARVAHAERLETQRYAYEARLAATAALVRAKCRFAANAYHTAKPALHFLATTWPEVFFKRAPQSNERLRYVCVQVSLIHLRVWILRWCRARPYIYIYIYILRVFLESQRETRSLERVCARFGPLFSNSLRNRIRICWEHTELYERENEMQMQICRSSCARGASRSSRPSSPSSASARHC